MGASSVCSTRSMVVTWDVGRPLLWRSLKWITMRQVDCIPCTPCSFGGPFHPPTSSLIVPIYMCNKQSPFPIIRRAHILKSSRAGLWFCGLPWPNCHWINEYYRSRFLHPGKPWDESLYSVTMSTIRNSPPGPPDNHNVPVLYVTLHLQVSSISPTYWLSLPRFLYLPH